MLDFIDRFLPFVTTLLADVEGTSFTALVIRTWGVRLDLLVLLPPVQLQAKPALGDACLQARQ
jgi:hypothetical protein